MSRSSTPAKLAVDPPLDGFVVYLREERGVSAATITVYVSDVRRRCQGAATLAVMSTVTVNDLLDAARVAGC